MKDIAINNKNLKIVFKIENNKIYYDYFGDETNNLLSNQNKTLNHIVELEALEFSHNGCHCEKYCLTPFGANSIYKSHKLITNNGRKELIIVTSDNNFEVVTHYVFYKNVSGFSIYNEVKNVTKKPLTLEYISSFYLLGIKNSGYPMYKNLECYYVNSGWYVENQWKHDSFLNLGIINGNESKTMTRFTINNTGSWSTMKHVPILGINDLNKNLMLLVQLENNGSYHLEISDTNGSFYTSFSGPTLTDNGFYTILKPNQTFNSCQASVVLSNDFESAISEITNLRRNLINKNSDDYKNLPIIYNDYMHACWDLQNEEVITPLINDAKDMGAEYFIIDAGYFHKGTGWTNKIGDWRVNEENFPNGGLKALLNKIRKSGMKVGIWVEIENMGLECPILSNLTKDYFMQINGQPIIRNDRYCLYFHNPKAYKWAMDIVSKLIKDYEFDYLKIDYNLSNGVGCNNDTASLGEGQLLNNRAFIKWIKELKNKFPHLIIENCGSGGMRMDYQMLSVCDIQSTSDQIDYRLNPYILSGTLGVILPEQCSMWSYPVDSFKKEILDEQVIMNMVTPMLSRICLSSVLSKLSLTQKELVKSAIKLYKSNKDFIRNSAPIYPLGLSTWGDTKLAVGLKNKNRILLNVYNLKDKKQSIKINLTKYNVKEAKLYYPNNLNIKYSYKNNILTIDFNKGYSARVFELITK